MEGLCHAQSLLNILDESDLTLINVDELSDMAALALTLLNQLIVRCFQVVSDFSLLEVLLLELLTAVEELFIHKCQATKFVLHLYSSFTKPCLSILFPFVKLLCDILQSSMHLHHGRLVLLQDLDSVFVFSL